ncbi:MAG TPA: XRE family transcriptional regulator [Acidobacteriaceae bacterium]|jgi:transcriptional regulator with XRE-family HTH domain|nr:XRE family transcriptional regulator [Acidobacteriaceae bacterium]
MAKDSLATVSETPADSLSVDPGSAETLLTNAHLGQRIKRLRLKRSMGLVELGKLTGLSASFLSQLETGRVVPTLRNLARIALVFNKDLSHFFEAGEQSIFRLQRRRDRVRLPIGSPVPDYITESFGILIPEGGLRPCLAEFLPGDNRSPFSPDNFPGVEMVFIVHGAVELQRKGEPHKLEARDVCYISGETQRSYRCAGQQPAQALIISFDRDPAELRRSARRRTQG